MFNVLLYIMLASTILCVCGAPFMALSGKGQYKYLAYIIINLYFSQLFMYYPGTDVSPYAYKINSLSSIKYFGVTLSAMTSIALIIFVVVNILATKRRISKRMALMTVFAVIPCLVGLLMSGSVAGEIDSMMKLITPFLLCVYLSGKNADNALPVIKKTITAVNVIMICQVLVCKLLTGSFAAYNYYYEMPEEYFGFYNHPHSFTGLLALLSVYNIYLVNRNEQKKLNLCMFVINVLLMWISGVRTYVVALAAALALIGLCVLKDSNMKHLRKYVYAAILVLCVFGGAVIDKFGSNRIVGDISSGRFTRWTTDIGYFLKDYSAAEIFFGRGIDSICSVNKFIFGVYINSLNMFIDLLLDFGILGMIFIFAAYCLMFRQMWSKNTAGFSLGIIGFFAATAMINSLVSYVTITTMMIIILFVFKTEGEKINENIGVEPSAVSRSSGKQRMVG